MKSLTEIDSELKILKQKIDKIDKENVKLNKIGKLDKNIGQKKEAEEAKKQIHLNMIEKSNLLKKRNKLLKEKEKRMKNVRK